MREEEWKDIPGYEGYYQASDLGRVRSVDRITSAWSYGKQIGRHYTGSIKRITLKHNGYLQATLAKDGLHKRKLVHRLVGMAFIPNPNNKPEINHRDGNKANNRIENLEWSTSKENQIHANNVLHAQVGENSPWGKFKDSDIAMIFNEYAAVGNCAHIARKYQVYPSTIRKIISRKTYRYAEVCESIS